MVKLPVKILWGKAIDDILILNDTMILIDIIVLPKFIFTYNIEKGSIPVKGWYLVLKTYTTL